MWKVLLVTIEIFTLLSERIFVQRVLTPRKLHYMTEICVWTVYFIWINYISYNSILKNEWDNTIVFIILFFIAMRILYTDTAWTLFLATAFLAIGGVSAEFLVYYGWLLYSGSRNFEIGSDNQRYLLMIVSKIVLLMFIKILLQLVHKRKNHYHELDIQNWIEVFMIPGGSILILIALFCRKESWNGAIDFLAIVMIMLINLFTYYLYEQVRLTTERKIREEVLGEQTEYYIRHYHENKKLWLELSEFRHNIKERYLLEQALLEQKNYEALKKHYENSFEKIQGPKRASNTGNFYFDSIINYKADKAQQYGIIFLADLMIPHDVEVQTEDLCIFLGNLLDNAIEAVKDLKQEKMIRLKIRADGSNILIVVANEYETVREKVGRRYVTTKENKLEHGLGLNIVRKIVRKYQGEVLIDDNGSLFEITVLMYGILL